jgi:hypothetical protein
MASSIGVDAQPFRGWIDHSDELMAVKEFGGLLGPKLVGVLARMKSRPGEEGRDVFLTSR